MKKYIITPILILTVLHASVYSQNFIQVKNGEPIEFKNYNFKKDEIIINSKSKGKITVPTSDIVGYYSLKNESTYHLKYDTDIYGQKSYYFVELILDGKIKLYNQTSTSVTSSGTAGGSARNSSTEFHIEKNNKYKKIFSTNTILQNKKENIEILKLYIQDQPEILKLTENEEFKLNSENIIRIIKDYNLSNFQPTQNNQSVSSVFIYLKTKGNLTDSLKVKVDDLLIGDIKIGLPISLSLPNNTLSKVCLNDYCEVLNGNPYYIKYYEIQVEDNKIIKFTQVKSNDAKSYLNYLYNTKK